MRVENLPGSQVDSADQLTHDMALDAENLKAEAGLDVFKPDPEYAAHEKEYEACCRRPCEICSVMAPSHLALRRGASYALGS